MDMKIYFINLLRKNMTFIINEVFMYIIKKKNEQKHESLDVPT